MLIVSFQSPTKETGHVPPDTVKGFGPVLCDVRRKSQERTGEEEKQTLTSAPEAPGMSSAILRKLMPRVRFIFLE